ncbi:MAG TPA: phytanoyl-CoA dioxygenase family protein, partial [Pyrinomonadaceae bacterium]|nr:phytanoyl-CoA dioxygenase family protein [Pyrinomonadaceae bacterium]
MLERFVEARECDALRERVDELVREFDPAGVVSIFTTHEQSRIADDYFMTSGDQIRFFFEENAFLPDGTLKQSKERSINKIGHALHDLDPVFNRFSRSESIRQLAAAIGFADA